ncbi:MAG: lysine--tRNA ligase [Chloroflexota bacterium]
MVEQYTDDVMEPRLEKLARLEEADVDPYPRRFERTHLAAGAIARFESLAGRAIRVAGRVVSWRGMGKATFCHIADVSGRLQLYLRRDLLGEEVYGFLGKSLDVGDIVGAEGTLFLTRTGEITLEVVKMEMLSKALRPLPEKWHGLHDVEKRYRQRYLDLIANDEVRQVFITRSRAISSMRRYLEEQGFIEVETPALQPIYGGAAAKPFVTHHNALDQTLYLRIATELYLKRLIVGGLERVYEIGKDFRNEGISTKHNPEFTMMECYQAYADYRDVAHMVEMMVSSMAAEVLGTRQLTFKGATIDVTPPWRRLTLREAIREESGIDYVEYPDREGLAEAMRAKGMSVDPAAGRGKLIDNLLSEFVEPKLIQPTFLFDYPVDLSPFAKRKPEDPSTVERFEAFAGGMEIANAFSELNDPRDQRQRFMEQARLREMGDEETQAMDEDFLVALEHGMPPTGGLGVGVDRVVMLLTDKHSIREVILFPQLRTR